MDENTPPQRPEPDRDEIVVAEFPKNRDQSIKARLYTFGGRRYGDVRIFAANADDADYPTRKGLSVAVDRLPELLEAVQALVEAAAAEDEAIAA
jgi:hypothetical protein